jgi:hypothetical protein
MVSALLTAWWMENTVLVPPPVMKKKTNKWHLVPILSIPRKSMHKHKDAAWLFDACGVDTRALLFSDEVELENLMKAGRVKTEDIGQDLLVTRNEVGSVCTLLGEQLQREADHLLQARYMKTLLVLQICCSSWPTTTHHATIEMHVSICCNFCISRLFWSKKVMGRYNCCFGSWQEYYLTLRIWILLP